MKDYLTKIGITMIKVQIGESKTQEEKPFPKLMLCTDGWAKGAVVLFFKPEVGVRLSKATEGDGSDPMFKELTTSFNMSKFTDFNEPITIQNL